jgi:hypothetical protein
MRYRHGRATVSPYSSHAWGRCDRCYNLVDHSELRIQYRYAGSSLSSTGKMVCNTCMDIPNPQERPLYITADPVPILNPRPSHGDSAIDFLVTSADVQIEDDAGDDFII